MTTEMIEVFRKFDNTNYPYYDNLDELHRLIGLLSYDKLLKYENNLGEILYPPPQNKNDWTFLGFILAEKEQIAEALYLTLK